jgi:hypothetical protein
MGATDNATTLPVNLYATGVVTLRRVCFALALLAGACGGSPGGSTDGGDDDAVAIDAGPDAGPDPTYDLYDPAVVRDIHITLPPASVAALNADPRTYVSGDLEVDGETVTNVGVRLKGEYNFRTLDQKAAFKIKLDEFVTGQTFHGLHRMTLNNSIEDPSFVAERLVYVAFRAAGVSAPRCNSARVFVNGELFGLYVDIETEDKTFVSRWHDDATGNLYEELGYEFLPGNEDGFDLETNTAANDRSDLTAFFAAIAAADDATLDTDLDAVLDFDQFFRGQALEAILNQWDGYGYTQFGPNNFRIYHEPATGKFTYIPWGMDMSLKPLGAEGIDVFSPTGLLVQRCLAGDTCRARYVQIVRDMADLVDSLDLVAQADVIHAQIAALIDEDPRKESNTETCNTIFDEERAWLTHRTADVRASLP